MRELRHRLAYVKVDVTQASAGEVGADLLVAGLFEGEELSRAAA